MGIAGLIFTFSLIVALFYLPFFKHFIIIFLLCVSISMIISLISKFITGIINLIKFRRWSIDEPEED